MEHESIMEDNCFIKWDDELNTVQNLFLPEQKLKTKLVKKHRLSNHSWVCALWRSSF